MKSMFLDFCRMSRELAPLLKLPNRSYESHVEYVGAADRDSLHLKFPIVLFCLHRYDFTFKA
jgi:hypothetical protein